MGNAMSRLSTIIQTPEASLPLDGLSAVLDGRRKSAAGKSRADRLPTVAVDLDGTLASMYDKFDPKKIEKPRPGAKKSMQRFRDEGYQIIINTVRGDKKLVRSWLEEHDIPFDHINENPDQPEDASDKVVADLYLDDRAVDARRAWKTVADETIKRIEKKGELSLWRQVPALVTQRLKLAAAIRDALKTAIKDLPAMPGYGYVYWHPENKTAWIVLGDSDGREVYEQWEKAVNSIDGVDKVIAESEVGPSDSDNWIMVKKASALEYLGLPYRAAGKLTGGPSAMSNSIVSGLLGAGLGYGGGWLAEQLLPEEYLERGKLRRNLAILGGLGGAALHVPQGLANAQMNQNATGKPQWRKSFLQPVTQQNIAPSEIDYMNHYKASAQQQALDYLDTLGLTASDQFEKSVNRIKRAVNSSGYTGSRGVALQSVPVDAFNRAIWGDAGRHTPPMHAAAASGLVTGVQQLHGNPSMLSPRHFIRGLATAGVDLATAHIAGGVLGVLGGLKPQAQKKLQNMGLWGGMIRGVTGSVLGLR